jgi:hypothetical protein
MSTTELLEKYISYLGVKQGRARSAAHIREVHRRVSRMLAGLESVDVLTSERIEATLYELAQEIVTKPGSPPAREERADDRRLQARTRNVLPLAPEASRPHDEPGRRRRSLRGGRPARPLAAVLPRRVRSVFRELPSRAARNLLVLGDDRTAPWRDPAALVGTARLQTLGRLEPLRRDLAEHGEEQESCAPTPSP